MKRATSNHYDIEIDKQRFLIDSFDELLWFIRLGKRALKGVELPNLSTTASNVFNNETEENQKKMASSKDLKAILPQTTWRKAEGAL